VPTSDPEELIKQASDVMNHGGIPISVTAASIGGTFPNSFHFSYLRAVALQQAALTSGRAIELLKQQPVPTDPAEKDKYTALLLKGLSIRVDRSQGIKAQIAYQDYLAAESDELKKENAERNYAAMLDKLEEVEKARVAYEALLARNPTDADALEALVSIHRKRAVAQKRAGKIRAARMSNQLARSYSDRLTEVRVTDGSVTTSDSVSDGTKADRDTVFKRGEAVKRFMEPVKVNPETRRESTVPMRAKKP
jgi:tetratricopeptide (TPR) repeat protein